MSRIQNTQAINLEWYKHDVEKVLQKLGSSPSGISSAEANLRLAKFGPNALETKKKGRAHCIVFETVHEPADIHTDIRGAHIVRCRQDNQYHSNNDSSFYQCHNGVHTGEQGEKDYGRAEKTVCAKSEGYARLQDCGNTRRRGCARGHNPV